MGITIKLEESCNSSLQHGASVIFTSSHHYHSCFFLAFSMSVLKSATTTPLWRVLLAKIGIYAGNMLSSIFSKWWSDLVFWENTLWWLCSAYFATDSLVGMITSSSLLINALINEDCCKVPACKPKHFILMHLNSLPFFCLSMWHTFSCKESIWNIEKQLSDV